MRHFLRGDRRAALERAREAYARVEGQTAPFYGLAASLAISLPLLVGTLTGHAAQGGLIALGAYLVALRTPEGPYGARARNLASAVLVIAVGATIGGNLAAHAWLAVIVVPPVVALGSAVPWIGPTAGLAVLLTAIRPPTGDVLYGGFLELLGGLLTTALLLAPWPARRLRPLRTTLSEAADAVAAALDAVAEDVGGPDPGPLEAVELTDPGLASVARKPDWDERRRAASQALTAARATYGFYRSGRGREEPTRPERLIDALARIMQETVALRALVEAARRRPPDREWEQEARVAIAALAARVRLVAGAIEATGKAPLGTVESAAIRRFGRQTESIRRAGLAGDEDLVAVALIVQIRRSVERIAGGVNAARRLAAGGVRIGFGPPRLLAEVPGPVSTWGRLGRAVRTRSPGFREVGRVTFIAFLAMFLATALDLPHGQWMTITAMFSLRGTYGQTVDRVVQRVGGTAVGSAIAALLLALAPDQTATALIIFAFALVSFTLRAVNFVYWELFNTVVAMMLLGFSVPSTWVDAGERIGLTIAGGLLAFLAVRLLWPTGHAERLPVQADRLLSVHADLARSAAAVVEGNLERLPHDQLVAAERAAETLADTRSRLVHERLPDEDLIDRLGNAVDAAHRVRDNLIAIGRMTREHEVDAGPLPEILDRLADHLEEVADSLDEPEPALDEGSPDAPSPNERLDEEFSDLDTHLSALARRRREEIKAGVSTDEFTPLRHALLQSSGTRYTARSLRADVETLIENTCAALAPQAQLASAAAEQADSKEPRPVS
ncbi:FUSC family protein [Actinomadura rugatobispora]|uniref:FUSC family protein n=1 Tax=Actinomadura rugatobispora TaxID=1994 RepID=A0ABW1A4S5_9ACTN|nr:hypothetical protein GCM10010200_044920 [Actinomadura rugatobispora]